MKILIVMFGLLAWIGCQDEIKMNGAVTLETDAVWSNMLASDGCSWHFAVAAKDSSYSLVPTDASLPKIEAVLGKQESYYSLTNVHIKYSLTGLKKDVKCGWGHTAQYNEVEIYEISKRP